MPRSSWPTQNKLNGCFFFLFFLNFVWIFFLSWLCFTKNQLVILITLQCETTYNWYYSFKGNFLVWLPCTLNHCSGPGDPGWILSSATKLLDVEQFLLFSLCVNGSDSNFNLLICICRNKISNSRNQYLLWEKHSVLSYFSEEFVFSLVFVLGTFLFAIESTIRRHVINSLYCWSCYTKILFPLRVTLALMESHILFWPPSALHSQSPTPA